MNYIYIYNISFYARLDLACAFKHYLYANKGNNPRTTSIEDFYDKLL